MQYDRYFRVIVQNILLEICINQHTTCSNKWIAIADGVLLVYNTEFRFSFDRLNEYIKTIFLIKGSFEVPMVLVGCIPQNVKRRVSKKEGHEVAKEIGVPFKEFGIENGSEVCKVFTEVIKQIKILKGEEQKRCKLM